MRSARSPPRAFFSGTASEVPRSTCPTTWASDPQPHLVLSRQTAGPASLWGRPVAMARDQESTNQSGSAHPPVPPAAQADRGVPPPSPLTRRGFLQALGGTALAGGAATLVGGCGKPQAPNLALDRRIKIGYVLPLTGAQGAFAEAENFNINKVREVLKNGLVIGKDHYGIDVIVKDS